ncbi:putative NOP5 family protein [uncultured archaeon]|nr:putative NOP5 family protein [uncultured archaeon]
MQVRTWFGIFTLTDEIIVGVELFQKNIDTLLDRLVGEPLLLRGKVAGVDLCDLAMRYGFVTSKSEYDSMLHELNIGLARKQVAWAVAADTRIIAAVEAIDDIDETANILAERLKEWYILNSNETNLKGEELARHITGLGGIDPEIRTMQSFAEALLGLYSTRLLAEEYLKENMHVIAPNLTSIAGHILGARLLSIAGSLERLASMSSSTVQVIGAGNALFKHLKGKAPSPKHGVIFRHPFVNTAPKKIRGKVARAVASKISLAARYDYYSGEMKESLKDDLNNKVQGIKKIHFKRKSSG